MSLFDEVFPCSLTVLKIGPFLLPKMLTSVCCALSMNSLNRYFHASCEIDSRKKTQTKLIFQSQSAPCKGCSSSLRSESVVT